MKILYRYILREHIAPFFFAFFVITFLLIIDYVPRIIDTVIDKNIGLGVVMELIGLNLAWMLALSIPMSVLVATLMAFGRLSGDFEIIAVKSSGINVLRIFAPLLLLAALLTYGMIQFNDKVLPDLNKRARLLYGDITSMRPTLVFKSGMFITDIPGYLVLIDHINHGTSEVRGVRITDTRVGNKPRIVVAERGFLQMTDGGRNMQFTLYKGEIHSLDLLEPENYRKVDFDDQVINISGTGSELVRSESDARTDREMGLSEMRESVAKAVESMRPNKARISQVMESRYTHLFGDSLPHLPLNDTLSDSAALSMVKTDARVLAQQLGRNQEQVDMQTRIANKYKVEIYKKYAIPTAALVFVIVGAPLGMMTRRSGMGMAVALSIVLFVVYWAFLIGGEDLADRGLVTPFWAMWGANILLGMIGSYLVYIVVSEKPIFSWFRRIG
ncbi:MAG: LptF/LptG family permease [candidate division Zixibacteria bacterium]|nr:LptF/LptG family permease [candidate division Zixibacteria bacterium]